jgi:hypothetical protein
MHASNIASCILVTLAMSSGQLINHLEVKTESGRNTGMFEHNVVTQNCSKFLFYCWLCASKFEH